MQSLCPSPGRAWTTTSQVETSTTKPVSGHHLSGHDSQGSRDALSESGYLTVSVEWIRLFFHFRNPPRCGQRWPTQTLRAFFLISDDIRDASISRCCQPFWYCAEGIEMMVIDDAYSGGAIFQMIRNHFRNNPFYVDLINRIHDVRQQPLLLISRQTPSKPQRPFRNYKDVDCLFPLITVPEERVNLSLSHLDKHDFLSSVTSQVRRFLTNYMHRTFVLYKTVMYSFYPPVALALLCGFASREE